MTMSFELGLVKRKLIFIIYMKYIDFLLLKTGRLPNMCGKRDNLCRQCTGLVT
jgi:hypothetical protein